METNTNSSKRFVRVRPKSERGRIKTLLHGSVMSVREDRGDSVLLESVLKEKPWLGWLSKDDADWEPFIH